VQGYRRLIMVSEVKDGKLAMVTSFADTDAIYKVLLRTRTSRISEHTGRKYIW
jgi:hypothetical protein